MTDEKYLVTGGLGCIGAWVVRNLVREGIPVSVFDLATTSHRLELILTSEEIQRVSFITGDISSLEAVQSALQASQANRIIHLAALQVPFCKADPSLGARVNVVGTVNVFEAARQAGLGQVVYASSVAVYGLSEDYPAGSVTHDAPLNPAPITACISKPTKAQPASIGWTKRSAASGCVLIPCTDRGVTRG